MILKVALTLAPGAMVSAKVFIVSLAPEATALQPLGTVMLSLSPETGSPVVLVKVRVVSCEDSMRTSGVRAEVAVAEAGARLSRCTSYLAATTLALHELVGGVGGEGARGGHRAFVEGALGADAVVAAIAQQDGALFSHRVIGGVDAGPIEHDLQGDLVARRLRGMSSDAVRLWPSRSRIAR